LEKSHEDYPCGCGNLRSFRSRRFVSADWMSGRLVWHVGDAGCTRIRQIPGIGPVVATAIVAAIGNGGAFRKGREFAAWLGIVPRQYSTGGKAKLLGISKRGNACLRKILVHGARAAMLRIKRDRAPIGAWLGSHGQQARTDRMGCVVEWKRIAPDSERICRMK
jgi:hypothetical protein